jgi:hypothetical protein
MANPPTGQTANDLIRRALLMIGVLGSGEVPTGDESNDALLTLQDMLDAWNSEGLMIFTTQITDFPISGAKQIYTLGAGGDFDIDRPAVIDRCSIILLSNPAQPLEYPIPVYTTQDWQEKVPIKNSPGNIPLLVYDDGGFPLRTLTFWPFATDNTKFRLYSWQQLTQFADLVTAHAFPPGYSEAIRYNLAVRLAPEFGMSVTPELVALALQSLAAVKSSNADDTQLRSDIRGSYTPTRMRSELFNIP